MKKLISFIVDGIMSGIFLCIGCAVYMSAESKAVGAVLFGLGLFAIINFKFGLYTGKAGYMAIRPPSYIIEVIFTILGNAIGAAIGGTLLGLTRFGGALSEKAADIISAKFADSPLSIFVLAVFCGVLMFTAVEGNRKLAEKGDYVGALFIAIVPVMVFIICGFNHCVADMAYFFISGCAGAESAAVYFIFVILGNALGCMLIPLIKKLSINSL